VSRLLTERAEQPPHAMIASDGPEGRALMLLILVIMGGTLLLASCAGVEQAQNRTAAPAGIGRPVWRVGERWVHAWTAGTASGTKVSEVIGLREVGGVQFYDLRVDTLDRYYTLDLHWAAGIVDSKVAARAVPPQPWFNWPLEVGKHWEYQGVYEEKDRKDWMRETYRVVGVEQVEVPAGTFHAFKLVREVDSSILDQYWYSPDVHWYVKWLGRRGKEQFEEVLQKHVIIPRTMSPVPSADRPGGAVGSGSRP
jgi:hypothetical protein